MICMLEIENKIRGYVSGMEPSLGGNRTRLLQGLEPAGGGGGEKGGNPAEAKNGAWGGCNILSKIYQASHGQLVLRLVAFYVPSLVPALLVMDSAWDC